ncbi:asparaginase [Ferdinandcohnia quinoae]|uniref:asparaginase n=1 Tax=Fredinandcohnia quinoae TaxID=2918902 RepID=A0AAW5E4E7_9BACI|nr:asparaginase [Fredinandcohnia sp. SECRCQ15]MCH1624772.1 asparaginase [Fredinandcohnia sp. SECRCQ15]
MKKILIIHTGGTIAMMEDIDGTVHPDNHNPLHQSTKLLSSIANIEVKELFHLPSPHITSKEMQILKESIESSIIQDKIDGVVITHGTDTLEETAYFLDITVQSDIPIVVTGAMRSSNELGADGPYNLISSVRVAACDSAKGKGVLVVLNDEIHTAKNVTKTHTSNIATFQSPQYGPIGIVSKRGVSFHHIPIDRDTYGIKKIKKNVVLLKAYAGMDGSIIQAVKTMNINGLVIEALGQGNLPPTMVSELKKLIDSGIPVVLVSRCFNGYVQDVYSYDGGGRQLKELGVIFSNGLNGQKARIKLLVALEITNNHQQLQEMFLR